jgi:hypothetical protein
MDLPKTLSEEWCRLRSNSPDLDLWVLFRQAEKEYSDSLAPKEPVKYPNRDFCSEGRKHQLAPISGEWTCCECGLIVDRVREPERNWNHRTITRHQGREKTSIRNKFESFCTRMKITYSDLSVGERRLIEGDIQKVRDTQKPERKTLPNLRILTYQICKRLGIEMDEKLLKIPVSKVSRDRCRKVFQTLGWEYIE